MATDPTTVSPSAPAAPKPRLASLDAMRGLTLLILTMVGAVIDVVAWKYHLLPPWLEQQCSHAPWGAWLNAWDMLMPMFLFMAGTSIPFALERYRGQPQGRLRLRLLRRFVVLWVLGMVAQGALLTFDWQRIRLYSNTLQAIAVGCLGASILYLKCKDWRRLAAVVVGLLLVSWAVCAFAGGWDPGTSFPERLDRLVLGRFQDGARLLPSGAVAFNPDYHYAWLFPSLNFLATTLTGTLAGALLRRKDVLPSRKCAVLAGSGAGLMALAAVLHATGVAPMIKYIWSSGMVLATTGFCFVLLGVLYAIMDWAGVKRWSAPLQVIGKNSILAYLLSADIAIVSFDGFTRPLLVAVQEHCPPAVMDIATAAFGAVLLYLLLALLDRAKLYLRA